jgi:hypothetical protein
MNIDLHPQQNFYGVKDSTVDSVFSPLETVPMMSFAKTKGGDITMSGDQTVLKSHKLSFKASAADRKFSAGSGVSTDFMSSVHSNSGTKKSE